MTDEERNELKDFLSKVYPKFKEIYIKDKPLEDVVALLERTI